MVFLSYPADAEAGPLETPGFALRALHSLIFKSLIVSAIKNPFTLVTRGLWHIGSSGAAAIQSGAGSASGPPPPLNTGPAMNLAEWERHLDAVVSGHRQKGKVEFYIDGEKFFPAFIQSVEGAVRSVDM